MTEKNRERIDNILGKLKWYGHASFSIESDRILYIDPWNIPASAPKADIILVTHSHFDHLSPDDINRLKKEDTIIVCSSDCVSQLSGDVRGLLPDQEVEIQGINIKAVPAYNPAKPFHPQKNEWLGFVFTMEGVSIYHAGDTDIIPEMEDLGAVNIALLPVGGKYTTNAEQAAATANLIKPDVSIPMHWGADVIGTEEDASRFKELCQGEVMILKEEEQ
jgi:L-ascorbate metabolism protein UlaG (beta-lactamase superfamily)